MSRVCVCVGVQVYEGACQDCVNVRVHVKGVCMCGCTGI